MFLKVSTLVRQSRDIALEKSKDSKRESNQQLIPYAMMYQVLLGKQELVALESATDLRYH